MSLPVTPAVVERAAAGLAEGGWRFTPRQLYYATCAEAEIPPTHAAANGEIGLGVLLVLVGLILIGVRVAFVALVSLGAALILAGVATRLRRPALHGRLLALSWDEFRRRFAGLAPAGLVDPAAWAPDDAARPASAAVVCDTVDTAAMVAANRARGELGDVLVLLAGDALPGVRTVALHDASPAGCALAAALQDAGIEARDAGLRPAEVDGSDHQILEGAPARLPRDLAGVIEPAEIDWLLSGRRAELATLAPRDVLARLREALAAEL